LKSGQQALGLGIIPLRLRKAILCDETERLEKIPFTHDHLAAALRRRQLVPNLLAMVLEISILPGVRVLGGCRQVVYYPLMRHVTATALAMLKAPSMARALSPTYCRGSGVILS
jgi:hypothetical protein